MKFPTQYKMHPFVLPFLFTFLYLTYAIPPHRPPLTTTHSSRNEWAGLFSGQVSSDWVQAQSAPQTRTFFEVTRPIPHPNTTPCSHLILQHDFAYTYNHPPTTVLYTPPSHCPSTHFSTVILELSATCKGRQFDRILGVWLGGVELLRSSTAEPTRDGIYWKVEKDISRYISLLQTPNQTLTVYLGNVVDSTYTGVYHVNVTLHYYPAKEIQNKHDLFEYWPDLILPLSRNEPRNDGLWFEIQNSTQVESREVVIPRNVYRAVLEVYVSYHENDEFWDTNLPNDYLLANNLSKGNGNGNFREVLVSLDGDLVGAICPFAVIFTGGINPLLWRPISGIGSFNLPSYDVEITPFLGKLLDGKPHMFGFSVTNSVNVWLVDANLHLWLDRKGVTKGQLLEHNAKPLRLSYRSNFKGLDGKFFTVASRLISSTGWVESSHGNITTTSTQKFDFKNFMELRNNGSLQTVNRTIDFNTSVSVKLMSSSSFHTIESCKRFPLYYYGNQIDQGNEENYTLYSNVTLGFNEDRKSAGESGLFSSSLGNEQVGDGIMVVKNGSVDSAIASMHQVYEYDESSQKFCYFRNVSSYNYTILYDEVRKACRSGHQVT